MRKYICHISFFVCLLCILNEQQSYGQACNININSIDVISVDCNDMNTGQITVDASGGTGALYYSLYHYDNEVLGNAVDENIQTPVFGSLTAGVYLVVVNDNNCSVEQEVAYPQELTYTVHKTDVKCYGESTGGIELTDIFGGGTRAMSFILTDANGVPLSSELPNALFDELSVGVYKIQINVSGACGTLTDAIVIEQPDKLKIDNFTSKPTTCRIPPDGIVTAYISGGVAPYTFECDNVPAITTANLSHEFTGLSKGTHQVRAVDCNGCETDVTNINVEITPNPLVDAEQSKLARCDSVFFTGEFKVIATAAAGGSNLFRYRLGEDGVWQDTPVFTGLTEDNYTVTVIDGNDCETTIEIFFVRKTQPSVTATGSNIQCFNGTGTIVAEAFAETDFDNTPGSIANYQLFTENGDPVIKSQTTGTFTNLTSGNYVVHVKDSYGCENQATATVLGPEARLSIGQKSVIQPFGNTKGSITITASGGWEGYNIVCNRIMASISQEIKNLTNVSSGDYTFNNLDAGQYQFTMIDQAGCSAIDDKDGNFSPLPPLVIDLDQATGEIDLDATDLKIYPNPSGNGRFTVEWSNHEIRRVTLEIYSISGQLLHKTNAQTGVRTTLDISSQGYGTYLLHVPELNIRQKLVIYQ